LASKKKKLLKKRDEFMCGIFGYIGNKNATKLVIEGLKKIEYRGYDSAGFASIHGGSIIDCKKVGRVAALEAEVKRKFIVELPLAIAQTRWATHGKVTELNAHPHLDHERSLAIVHNGIIENYESLRVFLKEKGISFLSDTDTEIIAHLIAFYYKGDILEAVQLTVAQLKGSYAIALIHRDFPDQIIAVAHEIPLIIGIGQQEAFISSDSNAFAFYTKQAIYLSNSEIAVIKADSQQIYNMQEEISKESYLLENELAEVSK
jgi:glucosamine--fructose-6-phosphate aminotransferase (isomerizing)